MAGENEDRVNIPFKVGELQDLGITSTQRIIDAGESFLNGSPEDIEVLDEKEEDDDSEKVIKTNVKDQKKPVLPKDKLPIKEEVKKTDPVKTELSEEDAFELLNTEDKKEDKIEDKDEDAIVIKDKKVPVKADTKAATKEEEAENEDDPAVMYTSFAEELVNQGIFEAEEDEQGNPVVPEVKNAQEFLELFQLNARRVASETIQSFLDSKGEEARQIFDDIIVNGVNPREYISRYAKVQDFKTLDLTNELNQEKVVREFYRQAGSTPESIDRKLKYLKDNAELATEAEDNQKVLVKREEDSLVELSEQKKKDDTQKQQVRSEYVGNIAKIVNEKAKVKDFDGIPVDNKIAQEVYNDLTVEKYTLGEQLLTEFDKDILELNRPTNHPMKVKLALLLRMLKSDPKLSSLSKKVISKEADGLFQGLKRRNAKAGGTSGAGGAVKEGKAKTAQTEEEKITSWFVEK